MNRRDSPPVCRLPCNRGHHNSFHFNRRRSPKPIEPGKTMNMFETHPVGRCLLGCLLIALATVVVAETPENDAEKKPAVETTAANSTPKEPAGMQLTIDIQQQQKDGSFDNRESHLVLFHQGVAYAFALSEPHDVTIVDAVNSRIALLSRKQQTKAVLPQQDVINALARIKQYAAENDLEGKLGLDAVVEGNAPYRIQFEQVSYQATTQKPGSALQAAQFLQYSQWIGRVTLIRKLWPPLFARMALDEAIANDGQVPKEVTLTLGKGDQATTLRSVFRFESNLDQADLDRIEKAKGMLRLYQDVPVTALP